MKRKIWEIDRKRLGALALLILCVSLAMFSTACEEDEWVKPDPSVRHLTDDLGRPVTIPAKITRVISLAPSVTENLFAVGAGDRIVGVTTFCNYPEQAKSIAKVGDTINPNMESIIALKPDLVFVSTASQIEAFTTTLAANKIAVYVTNPVGVNGIFRGLRQLGEIMQTTDVAEKTIADLQRRVAAVEGATAGANRPKVFVQVSNEPLFTIGKESFLTEVIGSAGGVSATADVATAYPKLSKETASALAPDVIVLSESDDNLEPNVALKNSPAVKNGRVFKISADLLSRPGPRLIDALEQMAKDIHPEAFPK